MPNEISPVLCDKSPLMSLPRELLKKICEFLTAKPNGYIGRADDCGVECALGAEAVERALEAQANGAWALLANGGPDGFHFPSDCRHPSHEKNQMAQDFRDYRNLNLARTCRQMSEDVEEAFFQENGFELGDAQHMLQFLRLIGDKHASLIRKFTVFYNINLKVEDVQNMFTFRHARVFYYLLEQDYLDDDGPTSDIVHVMKYIKTMNNIQNFNLVYRLEIPQDYFMVSKAPNFANILHSFGFWQGESKQWESCMKNVLEKLRQDSGVGINGTIDIQESSFWSSDVAEKMAVILGVPGVLQPFYRAMALACINHAETCIEWSDTTGRRIMPA